eukprot:5718757-Karenia_brevis.AAC.1
MDTSKSDEVADRRGTISSSQDDSSKLSIHIFSFASHRLKMSRKHDGSSSHKDMTWSSFWHP